MQLNQYPATFIYAKDGNAGFKARWLPIGLILP
jgi:hypothetical protein